MELGWWVQTLQRQRQAAGIGVLALSVALLDYRALRSARDEVMAYQRDAQSHGRLLKLMSERLAELRAEVATWPGLHAAILKPLGRAAGRRIPKLASRFGLSGLHPELAGRPLRTPNPES